MHISFIQTGGTIDKDYPSGAGAYSFEIGEPAVQHLLKKLRIAADYEVIPLLQKDSQDLTDDDRQQILDKISNLSSDKIIVTHGTDTMVLTGQYLRPIRNKTVIITGSLRPASMKDSDAELNVGAAIGAVQHLKPGIYICMNGIVKTIDDIKRDMKTGNFY